PPADFLAELNRLEHRAIAVAAAPDVVDFPNARRPNERSESLNQLEAVDVVAHLFPLVAEDAIRAPADRALHEIGEKPVQLRAAFTRLRVPLALTVKSVCGSRAAQSCDGCAAVCTIAPSRCACRLKSSFTAPASRMSISWC